MSQNNNLQVFYNNFAKEGFTEEWCVAKMSIKVCYVIIMSILTVMIRTWKALEFDLLAIYII